MPEPGPHDPLPSLKELEQRIAEAKPKSDAPGGMEVDPVATSRGMAALSRLAIELLAALLVGLGGGWWLDNRLGTTPWLMLLGLFLGSAAGFLNVKRAAEELDKGRD